MNKFFQSKAFKIILIVIGCFIVLMLVFKLGMIVGSTKERFFHRWAENYSRNFGGMGEMKAHGDFGQIIKIELPTIVIKGEKDVEKVILLKDDTIIERFREKISSQDLKVNDKIVIIGSANDVGQIEAKMIRIMP